MKSFLESFLLENNIKDITHGIAYNTSNLSQIKYWDRSGKQYEIEFKSQQTPGGIFCFKLSEGSIILL